MYILKNIIFIIRTVRLAAVDESTMSFSLAGILSRIFCLNACSRFTTISMSSTYHFARGGNEKTHTYYWLVFHNIIVVICFGQSAVAEGK